MWVPRGVKPYWIEVLDLGKGSLLVDGWHWNKFITSDLGDQGSWTILEAREASSKELGVVGDRSQWRRLGLFRK